MSKRKTARETILAFIDEVMAETVAAHEELCVDLQCSVEKPCPYCHLSEVMMKVLAKY